MSYGIKTTKAFFQSVAHSAIETADFLQKQKELHQQRMKKDPQIRIATYHAFTYAACLAVPLAIGMYFSYKNDGTINVFRVPDGSEKIESVQPDTQP